MTLRPLLIQSRSALVRRHAAGERALRFAIGAKSPSYRMEEMSMTSTDMMLSRERSVARPLLTFLVLGFALSWYPWALHLLGRPGNGGPNPLGLLLAALIAGYFDFGWRGSMEILRSIVRV